MHQRQDKSRLGVWLREKSKFSGLSWKPHECLVLHEPRVLQLVEMYWVCCLAVDFILREASARKEG